MKQKRKTPNINASSMADIAFLLLVFFLVSTTISMDAGIRVKLPEWVDEQKELKIADHNLLNVKLNSLNQLMVENKEGRLGKPRVKGSRIWGKIRHEYGLAATHFPTNIMNTGII